MARTVHLLFVLCFVSITSIEAFSRPIHVLGSQTQRQVIKKPVTLAQVNSTSGGNATSKVRDKVASVHRQPPESSEITIVEEDGSKNWMGVYILLFLILIAVSPVFVKHGALAFLTVIAYLGSLSLVKMCVKATMNGGFQYPYSITLLHMLCTALLAAAFERPRKQESMKVFPISFVNGLSLVLNNTALVYGGVAFISMIGCSTPAFTYALELLRGRRELALLSFCPVLAVCIGAMLCVEGETTASIFSFFLSAASTGFRSLKSVWQHELLAVDISPMRMVFWSGFWSMVMTIPLVACSEGFDAFRNFSTATNDAKLNLAMSCITAAVLNTSQVFAVKQLGALLQTIVGNINLIMVLSLSAAWLHETVEPVQYVGVVLLVVGAMFTKGHGAKGKEETQDPNEKQPLATASSIPAASSYSSVDEPTEARPTERSF